MRCMMPVCISGGVLIVQFLFFKTVNGADSCPCCFFYAVLSKGSTSAPLTAVFCCSVMLCSLGGFLCLGAGGPLGLHPVQDLLLSGNRVIP